MLLNNINDESVALEACRFLAHAATASGLG